MAQGGCTPLHVTSRQGHARVAKLLLEARAQLDVRTTINYHTPQQLAELYGHDGVVALLKDALQIRTGVDGAGSAAVKLVVDSNKDTPPLPPPAPPPPPPPPPPINDGQLEMQQAGREESNGATTVHWTLPWNPQDHMHASGATWRPREAPTTTTTTPSGLCNKESRYYNGHSYYRGPRGGWYRWSSGGNKVYDYWR